MPRLRYMLNNKNSEINLQIALEWFLSIQSDANSAAVKFLLCFVCPDRLQVSGI